MLWLPNTPEYKTPIGATLRMLRAKTTTQAVNALVLTLLLRTELTRYTLEVVVFGARTVLDRMALITLEQMTSPRATLPVRHALVALLLERIAHTERVNALVVAVLVRFALAARKALAENVDETATEEAVTNLLIVIVGIGGLGCVAANASEYN
jgi:hypothetical protein